LTLTNEAVATSGNNKGNTANDASKSVRDGGIRITMTRDEGIDLLADFGDMFNVSEIQTNTAFLYMSDY
jgi:hypothetical protein